MGTIEIKKVERKVTVGKKGEQRQQVKKTYGKIIYRGTLRLTDMAEHIMKHGSIYTEDVVIGVITKLKSCMQEMLADGYKVKLDGIGTLYPVLTSLSSPPRVSLTRRTSAPLRMSPAWALPSWPTRARSLPTRLPPCDRALR